MERQQGYQERLAEFVAATARASVDPDMVLNRAVGLLAGRVGCRVSEAQAHLMQMASELGCDVRDLGGGVLAALEERSPVGSDQVRAALEQAVRPPFAAWGAAGDRPVPPGIDAAMGDWAGIVYQVLNVMPGDHALLLPLRDADQIKDYLIVAASPMAVDVAGRRGSNLVGLRIQETYPGALDGPVGEVYRDVLADGVPREIRPYPYTDTVGDAPMEFTVKVSQVGPGLLVSWVRHEEQSRLAGRIAQTERLGNLGWGEWDLVTGDVVWSDGLYRIYERSPAEGPLPREQSEALTVPEDQPIRREAVTRLGRGETIDVTYRIRVGGRTKHIRSVVDAVCDVHGRPLRVYGIVQDVTAGEASRATLAEVKQQLWEHQQSLAAEHRLTVQLQQIVLPIPVVPIDLPGLQVAVRYLPAEQASRVGGDWYHAATAHDGTVIIAVGDVAGHGLPAAATMAQLRHALAALTVTTTDPASLLSHLNRLLQVGDATSFATAVVARYSPFTATVVWAQAGHLAPLHTRAGVTTELERPAGPLLGAIRDADYDTASFTIVPGDLLLLYTDGLVEHRGRSLTEGLAPVVATLNWVSAGSGQRPLTDLLTRLPRANPDDDTCILAARPLLADMATGSTCAARA